MNRLIITAALCVSAVNMTDAQTVEVDEVSATAVEPWPIVIAHRGASGYLPEHTLEAAAYAHALGADYIEQDCVLTKDRVPVVLHDITLNRTTNVAEVFPDRKHDDGKWYAFDFTLAELNQLQVHERYAGERSNRFPRGKSEFHICTLRQQIELIQGLDQSCETQTGLYIELKQPARHHAEGLDIAREILKVLQEYDLHEAEDHIYLQCFENAELRRLRDELKCRLPLIQLLGFPPSKEKVREYARYVDGLGLAIKCVFQGMSDDPDPQPRLTDIIRIAHQHSLQVHVWTLRKDALPKGVNSPELLLDWLVQKSGADGVFSDHPDVVVRWRERTNPVVNAGPFRLIHQ